MCFTPDAGLKMCVAGTGEISLQNFANKHRFLVSPINMPYVLANQYLALHINCISILVYL